MGDLPTGAVTFLFTDIVQSTELVQRLGDPAAAELIATYVRRSMPRPGRAATAWTKTKPWPTRCFPPPSEGLAHPKEQT